MAVLGRSVFLQASVYLPTESPSLCTTRKSSLATLSLPSKPLSISNTKKPRFVTAASSVSAPPTVAVEKTKTSAQSPVVDSTRTVKTLLSVALAASVVFVKLIKYFAIKTSYSIFLNPNAQHIAAIRSLQSNLLCTAGPLFFASLRDRPSGYLNTPLTVVAAGLSKWLDIYSGVLMVRVLLSWFPNIPWDRQPLSAIRDLCDPYLNLFRNIIPPIFDTLDVSPLLAFAVLGTLGSILNNSRGMY